MRRYVIQLGTMCTGLQGSHRRGHVIVRSRVTATIPSGFAVESLGTAAQVASVEC